MRFFRAIKDLAVPGKIHLFALLLGGLGVLSFAPFFLSPLMLFSLLGLFWLWLKADAPRQGFKIGLWFGLGLFGFGVSWLFSSIYFYSSVWLPLAVILTFGFVFYLALFSALAGWLACRLRTADTYWNLLLVFPLVWMLGELLRGSVFGGYPFLLVGVSHLHTWVDGYAPLLGVWGVSLAVAMSASVLLLLVKKQAWVTSALVMGLVWFGGLALQQVQWVKPLGKPIDIALLQGNVPQERKWLAEEFMPTLKTYVGMTRLNLDAQVIVWPETAIPAYYKIVEKGALFSFIKDAQILNADVLIGVIDSAPQSNDYYNALINVHKPEDRYYKHHLVPFSEYFPFNDAFKFLSHLFDIPYATFTAGNDEPKPMELGGQKAGLSICFEMAFGEELARQLPEAKYLITVSNDAWFAHTFEPAQQLQDVQMRALELGREIARSTNTGYTAIVDVKGRIKQQIPAYQTGFLRGMIQPYDGMTFYAQWKWWPIMTILGLMLLALLWRKRLEAKQES
ncbi:apolipoprotein N-acyltransferase [Thiomicrorhabdus heinhorstiae]|uniref:Apolipoprotein N-acyltransferase n=1 Tax=Thiomicrorhabdus heinhorstiae TaxID=2748010 RepID=A0ABS0BXW4_9GAMM|nr:apolipoprotein N-acyltransferase [Thiomicrorhabdus heinhorstiae]MBF6058609.1 apolipoprotein N-acyltransferase [Thiomicrorhabdus heinhorstiae]